jgi:hypothetical protein
MRCIRKTARQISGYFIGATLLILQVAACRSDQTSNVGGTACNCGSPAGATVTLPCESVGTPAIAVTGSGCTAGQNTSQAFMVFSAAAGTCHLDVTFDGGTTYETDVDFEEQWYPCGSDPHGCGQLPTATQRQVTLGGQCDAGPTSEAGD